MTGGLTGTGSDDARLVALSVADPDQFGAVFDRYFTEIHGYVAKRLGRDVADDVKVERARRPVLLRGVRHPYWTNHDRPRGEPSQAPRSSPSALAFWCHIP